MHIGQSTDYCVNVKQGVQHTDHSNANMINTDNGSDRKHDGTYYQSLSIIWLDPKINNISRYVLKGYSGTIFASSEKGWVQKGHKTRQSICKNARVFVETYLNLNLCAQLLAEYHDSWTCSKSLYFSFPKILHT